MSKILRLDAAGMPASWVSNEEAAVLYCKDQVLWEAGEKSLVMRGGLNDRGIQSRLEMSTVIATMGKGKGVSLTTVNNTMLFRRDNYMCMYCGHRFPHGYLTRDHVHPKAQGGPDQWTNLVAACKRCNNAKGNRTPEEAGMPLLAIPFTPNPFENMFLREHKILSDQMRYLERQFSSRRDWHAA